MVIWCAYCQRFQGERAPFDDNTVTHGICPACTASGAAESSEHIRAIQPVARLMGELWRLGKDGRIRQLPEVIQRAAELRIRSVDLLVGLIAPLLAKVGRNWAEGTMSVAEEHRVTAFFEAVIHHIRSNDVALQAALDAPQPQVLLVNCNGNAHSVGLRVVELWLADQGVTSRIVVPGLPASEVVALADQLAPSLIGISIAIGEQVRAVQEILALLPQQPETLRVCVGGFAVKAGAVRAQDVPGTILIPQLPRLVDHLPPSIPPPM